MKKLICLLSVLVLTGCDSPLVIDEKQIALFSHLCDTHGGLVAYKPEGEMVIGEVRCKDKSLFKIVYGEVK